jgi:large subunit ribosomal protein L25
MPEITTLSAERRLRAGKGATRATRRMGRVPGIIYGGDRDPMLISLDPRELSRALTKRGFLAMVVEVRVDDDVHRTLPRDVQYHPATDEPLHVDFMRVGVDTRVTVTVPVAFINPEMSIGLRRGGILNIVRHGIALICQVDNIPEQLVVDLNHRSRFHDRQHRGLLGGA